MTAPQRSTFLIGIFAGILACICYESGGFGWGQVVAALVVTWFGSKVA